MDVLSRSGQVDVKGRRAQHSEAKVLTGWKVKKESRMGRWVSCRKLVIGCKYVTVEKRVGGHCIRQRPIICYLGEC